MPKAKRRPSRPSFKLPDSFEDRTTKSSGGVIVRTNFPRTDKIRGVRPGDTAIPAIFDYTNSRKK